MPGDFACRAYISFAVAGIFSEHVFSAARHAVGLDAGAAITNVFTEASHASLIVAADSGRRELDKFSFALRRVRRGRVGGLAGDGAEDRDY